MKTLTEIQKKIIDYYLDDPNINSVEEYLKVVNKINNILSGRRSYLKPDLDKITLLGFDAIILFIKLQNSTNLLLEDLQYDEEYELCALLRDINESIKNYLYDFEG
jgi:hypothetical protein